MDTLQEHERLLREEDRELDALIEAEQTTGLTCEMTRRYNNIIADQARRLEAMELRKEQH